MKAFEIFKSGQHTAASGTTLSFSEDDLRKAVEAYDPAIHEAPIVVGHPKDNGPAYGWIKALSYSDGSISAEPIQVEEQFAEMVQAGRFKKRSASFYTPDSPNNPVPGVYYLRHVGFLGAQPPAVKGLKDVAFSDAEEGVLEFSDSWAVASLFRGLREWFIGKFGLEDADKVVPSYLISSIEDEARREAQELADSQPGALPAFSEGTPSMTPDQIKAMQDENAQLKSKVSELEGQTANFSERETALAGREKAIADREREIDFADVSSKVDKLIAAGKVLPASRDATISFAMSLNSVDLTIDFKEGDEAKKISQRAAYLGQLEAGPKIVDYKEHSSDDGKGGSGELSNDEVVSKARQYVEKAGKEGRAVSFTEAVQAVHQGKA